MVGLARLAPGPGGTGSTARAYAVPAVLWAVSVATAVIGQDAPLGVTCDRFLVAAAVCATVWAMDRREHRRTVASNLALQDKVRELTCRLELVERRADGQSDALTRVCSETGLAAPVLLASRTRGNGHRPG